LANQSSLADTAPMLDVTPSSVTIFENQDVAMERGYVEAA
jgi:hypothetical protein